MEGSPVVDKEAITGGEWGGVMSRTRESRKKVGDVGM